MNQTEKVLDYLKKHGTITTYESYIKLKITRLPARINELRNQGYDIPGEMETAVNQDGERVKFKRYRWGAGN